MNEIQYPYLPEGRKVEYVSISNTFMQAAKESSKKESTDLLMPTGAVIVLDGKIVARGANNAFLAKNKWFRKRHQNGMCVRKLFNIPSGEGYWMCPGCVTNQNHAESTASKRFLKSSDFKPGADIYLWGHWWCCKDCWDNMIKAKINNVYLLENSEVLFKRGEEGNIVGRQFEN
jgi:deoxycytidylate deaminase